MLKGTGKKGKAIAVRLTAPTEERLLSEAGQERGAIPRLIELALVERWKRADAKRKYLDATKGT
jgi:hypothetical protein